MQALTRGPRPIEMHAHDPRRYVGDMMAWVHQSLASGGRAGGRAGRRATYGQPGVWECDEGVSLYKRRGVMVGRCCVGGGVAAGACCLCCLAEQKEEWLPLQQRWRGAKTQQPPGAPSLPQPRAEREFLVSLFGEDPASGSGAGGEGGEGGRRSSSLGEYAPTSGEPAMPI